MHGVKGGTRVAILLGQIDKQSSARFKIVIERLLAEETERVMGSCGLRAWGKWENMGKPGINQCLLIEPDHLESLQKERLTQDLMVTIVHHRNTGRNIQ